MFPLELVALAKHGAVQVSTAKGIQVLGLKRLNYADGKCSNDFVLVWSAVIMRARLLNKLLRRTFLTCNMTTLLTALLEVQLHTFQLDWLTS